jgi:Reverse transcriptase (RNA-dependent DNA polymerase)
MLFGLTNSPASYQALMNSIFVDLVAAGKVAVYLNDILIYSHSASEHQQMTLEMFTHLATYNLYPCLKKCEFQ